MCCYVGCYAVTALLTMLDSSRIQNMQPALLVVNSYVRISINKPSDLVLRKDRKEVSKEVRDVKGIGK